MSSDTISWFIDNHGLDIFQLILCEFIGFSKDLVQFMKVIATSREELQTLFIKNVINCTFHNFFSVDRTILIKLQWIQQWKFHISSIKIIFASFSQSCNINLMKKTMNYFVTVTKLIFIIPTNCNLQYVEALIGIIIEKCPNITSIDPYSEYETPFFFHFHTLAHLRQIFFTTTTTRILQRQEDI